MVIDPKDSPGFHLEQREDPEIQSTIEDFHHAASRTQRGALRLQSVANATQHDARAVRTATAERKRVRQSSYPTAASVVAPSKQSADPKLRCD